jgi:hypothetical protein
VSHDSNEPSFRRGRASLERAAEVALYYALVVQNREQRRLSVISARSLGTDEKILGRLVCTPDEASAVMAHFHRRVEQIIAD